MLTKVTKTARTIDELANDVRCRRYGKFQDKKTRDLVFAKLIKIGMAVRKTSTSGARLHPGYVTDFVGEYETGFGNTDYMTHWKRLYVIEVL